MLLCRLLFPRGSEGFLFSDSRKTASRQTHNTRSHPNMKKVTILISVLMLGAAFIRANADPAQITPVRWVIATQHNGDVNDKYVTLQGKVITPDQGSDWWFSDSTGSVRLDTGDHELPVGPMLIVSGHIDQAKLGIGYLEVEVKHWSYANH
jgi:uncharacterized protein YdeI (BOF family)